MTGLNIFQVKSEMIRAHLQALLPVGKIVGLAKLQLLDRIKGPHIFRIMTADRREIAAFYCLQAIGRSDCAVETKSGWSVT